VRLANFGVALFPSTSTITPRHILILRCKIPDLVWQATVFSTHNPEPQILSIACILSFARLLGRPSCNTKISPSTRLLDSPSIVRHTSPPPTPLRSPNPCRLRCGALHGTLVGHACGDCELAGQHLCRSLLIKTTAHDLSSESIFNSVLDPTAHGLVST
jgi:hypothetical protein